jgi:hypothetical protein
MIYIVIPNYNGLEHLETCFNSLSGQSCKDFRIILVDNGSKDNSVKFTKENYSDVIIIEKEFNTGFAAGVNTGISKALEYGDCEYVLLLNNDIECDVNFLDEMKKGFVDGSVGSVACKMMNYYKRNIFDDAGDFIKLIGSPYARGHAEEDKGQYDKSEYIFGACAGAALYRKRVFESIGLFDEDFFAYYEDVDFSLRMQLSGYKCYYNHKAVCYHKRGATSGYASGWQTMLCEKNLISLRIKNYPLSLYIRLTPLFIIGRLKRYYGFLRAKHYKVFFSALKGYVIGLFFIPKSLMKRIKIQKLKKVENKYIYKIFTD